MQYVSSGVYFARVKINGKIIWHSLETGVWSTAKLKLADFIKDKRSKKDIPVGSFAAAVDLFKEQVQNDTSLKQTSKDYRLKDCLRKIELSWPELWGQKLDKIKESECRAWGARLHGGIASQYFNNVVGTLRLVIEAGIRDHISRGGDRFENPANAIAKAKIPKTDLRLPEPGQFKAIIENIRNNPSGKGEDAADLVEFLAYSGTRLYTEAHWVTWEDIDWNRRELIVRGSPETHTKNWEQRRIPLLTDMEDLLQRIRSRNSKAETGTILKTKQCPGCLRSACKAVGIPAISHHDLRHLFATRCIESGVDIPTVSRWLGHKDGGALAMRTYGHLWNEHSQAMAQKVRF